MSKVMIQLRFPAGQPSLADAAARLGLEAGALDPEFGVIATDPTRSLYTVLVEAAAAARASGGIDPDPEGGQGIFSNPKIVPFWPPEE